MIEYFTIAIIAFLGAISPGPDFVVVTKNCLLYQRKGGILASIGISVGILIHTTYCVLGLALVISKSILLFDTIKNLGAIYLIYLGIKNILNKESHLAKFRKKNAITFSNWLAFRDGLLVNLLNPKFTLFILSVFTLVVKPHTSMAVQASFGVEISLISLVWFVLLSYGLTAYAIQTRIEKWQHLIVKIMGGLLVTIGLLVVFKSN